MTDFEFAALADQIPDGRGLAISVRGRPVALFRVDADVFAIDNLCPHAGAALAAGVVKKSGTVQCPLHGRRFDLRTGHCKNAAAAGSPAVVVHAARIVAGRVQIALSQAPIVRPLG